GCLLGCLRAQGFRIRTWLAWPALAFLVTLFAVGTAGLPWSVVELPFVEIAAAVLILAATTGGAASRILALRPLVWLGAVSYSLYVWQQFARWFMPGTTVWPELVLT